MERGTAQGEESAMAGNPDGAPPRSTLRRPTQPPADAQALRSRLFRPQLEHDEAGQDRENGEDDIHPG